MQEATLAIPAWPRVIFVTCGCCSVVTLVNFLRFVNNFKQQAGAHVNEQVTEVEQILASDQPKRSNSKLRHGLWAAGGFLCFALGMVGVVLPILPTTPFILVAAFCFARSSERLNAWFKCTKLYKQVLEGYVTKRSMTLKAKLTILIPVTALLAIGFALMGSVPVGRIVLAIVWAGHLIYFGFVVKTDKE